MPPGPAFGGGANEKRPRAARHLAVRVYLRFQAHVPGRLAARWRRRAVGAGSGRSRRPVHERTCTAASVDRDVSFCRRIRACAKIRAYFAREVCGRIQTRRRPHRSPLLHITR